MAERLSVLSKILMMSTAQQDNTRTNFSRLRALIEYKPTQESKFDPMQQSTYKFGRTGLDTLEYVPADQIDNVCQKLLGRSPDSIMDGCTWQYPPTKKQTLKGKILQRGPSITYLNEDWENGDLQNGMDHEDDHKRIESAKQAISFTLRQREKEHKPIPGNGLILLLKNKLTKIDSTLDAKEQTEYNNEGGIALQRNSNVLQEVQSVLDEFNQILKRLDK